MVQGERTRPGETRASRERARSHAWSPCSTSRNSGAAPVWRLGECEWRPSGRLGRCRQADPQQGATEGSRYTVGTQFPPTLMTDPKSAKLFNTYPTLMFVITILSGDTCIPMAITSKSVTFIAHRSARNRKSVLPTFQRRRQISIGRRYA